MACRAPTIDEATRGRCAVVVAAALLVACLSAAGESDRDFTGRVTLDYVPRWISGTDTGDQDISVGLSLDWRSPASRWSGSVYFRGIADIDGAYGTAGGRFRSVYDTYDDAFFGQLFYAYADYRSEGAFERARFGRQFLYEGHTFHFDGVSMKTRAGPMGVRLSAFGGVPVHFFEESRSGDLMAGAGIEMRPWRGASLRALYARIDDDGHFVGLPVTSESDDLLVASLRTRLGGRGVLLFRYTGVDGMTRDILARSQVAFDEADANVSIGYYRQPETLTALTPDLSAYSLVAGDSRPYDKLDISASKGFSLPSGGRVSVDARGVIRRLDDPADEGEYNRDYDLLSLCAGFEFPGVHRLDVTAGVSFWSTSGDDVAAFDASAHWEANETVRLAIGTNYFGYRYDIFSLAEETDVRETYFDVRWDPSKRVGFRFRYAAERYGGQLVHKMRLGCSREF